MHSSRHNLILVNDFVRSPHINARYFEKIYEFRILHLFLQVKGWIDTLDGFSFTHPLRIELVRILTDFLLTHLLLEFGIFLLHLSDLFELFNSDSLFESLFFVVGVIFFDGSVKSINIRRINTILLSKQFKSRSKGIMLFNDLLCLCKSLGEDALHICIVKVLVFVFELRILGITVYGLCSFTLCIGGLCLHISVLCCISRLNAVLDISKRIAFYALLGHGGCPSIARCSPRTSATTCSSCTFCKKLKIDSKERKFLCHKGFLSARIVSDSLVYIKAIQPYQTH